MALKTLSSHNDNFKLRSPSTPEIVFTAKGPKFIKHYQIGTKIGKGSYATVREAIDTHTNELVAIKICSKRKLSKIAGGLKAVRKEAKILSLLNHKNTIQLIEKFTIHDKDKLYLVMQYIPSGNLEQLMQRNCYKGLPIKQVRSLFKDLLEGLLYLRDLNIVHGDIKPENLLLSHDGRLIISDFGVSWILKKRKKHKSGKKSHRRTSSSASSRSLQSDISSCDESFYMSTTEDDKDEPTQPNDIKEEDDEECDGDNYGLNHPAQGTLAFEPPEVASGKKRYSRCGHELDLWAAGIVLCYITTGHYPFKGGSFIELIENISQGIFEELPSTLDSDLIDLIHLMLSVDPAKRPTIEEILNLPFMTKDLKCKKDVKMIDNDSIFMKKKDGTFEFNHNGKKHHAHNSECVIC